MFLLCVLVFRCSQKLRLLKRIIPATKYKSKAPLLGIFAGARDELPLISIDLRFAPAALPGMHSLRLGRLSKTFGCLVAHGWVNYTISLATWSHAKLTMF